MIILTTILLICFHKFSGVVQAVAPKGDIVTVCNSTYCDDLKPIQWCGNPSEFHLYITSENGDRFRHSVIKSQNTNVNPDAVFKITINPCKEYRKIIGFGGALTDASALMISCLSENAKKKLLNSYFHCDKGIGYYLIRTPLGGSDYSVKKYTYCDSDKPDPKLTKFALTEMDLKYKIPLILQAKAISCRTISIKGATWNAPSFMTTEEPANYTAIFNEALPPEIAAYIVSLFPPEMTNITRNRYRIKKAFETAWAEYLAMALTAYKNQGVPIKYVTPGNEVHLGASNYWTREDYQRWVTNILCPTLKKHGHDSTQLLALDDMTLFLGKWQKIFENPATRSCFKGVATHWYLDYFPEVVKKTQDEFCEKYPEQIMLPTESSTCEHDPTFHLTSDWEKAVKYAKDILLKLASCAQGYIDWNMVLDFIGGPNYIQNYCYAPVAVNCTADEFHKRVLFYVLGHFSKFLPEGSVRVDVTIKANELADSKLQPLQVVAFKVKSLKCSRPNIVIIVLNTNPEIAAIDVCFDKGKCTNVKVPKNSIISAVTPLPWNYACF